MIEIAAIAIGVALILDAFLIALADVRHARARIDRRWKR